MSHIQLDVSTNAVEPGLEAGLRRFGLFLLVILHHVLALTPIAAILLLYIFSWRVAALIGHWPQVQVDDPKFAAPGDSLSDLLYTWVEPLVSWSCISFLAFPVLTILLRKVYPRRWTLFLIGIFIMAQFFLFSGAGSRLLWYID